MNQHSPDVHWWLGLCRKAPVFRASQTGAGNPPEPTYEGSPDGGTGGPDAIRRGTGAALSGTKTLIHNPQLLWFTLLAGLVLAAHLLAQLVLIVSPTPPELQFFLGPYYASLFPSLALTFVAGLLTVFCLGFLLAGLALSYSPDGQVSFFRGLRLAKKYLVPLTGGSVVAAIAGIQVLVHPFIIRGVLFVHDSRWLLLLDPYYSGLFASFVLTFVIELLTVFCMAFLLAGLTLSISSEEGGTVSFFRGFTMAKKYLVPLAGWSVVVALAGTLLFTICEYSNVLNRIIWGSLLCVQSQFPFNFVLEPFQYVPFMQADNWWFISFALDDMLILFAITVFLFVLTLFVVPLLVLERKSLREAVLGSCILMKKIWGEVAACVLGLGMVVFAVSLLILLFQFSGVGYGWWDSGQIYTSFTFPSNAWAAAALLYVLALSGLTLVAVTVGGIASLDLYRYAKSGHMPKSAETETIS
ncbi:DUF6159 family protein [Methanoregula sp.]|uniref:DUF6159 family protein n=1 Tax=Methanoregula sp. TaxID=2052170 RepID=UPI003C72ED1C